MKRLVIAVAGLLLAGGAAHAGTRDFASPEFGFSLSYPDTWEVREAEGGIKFKIKNLQTGMLCRVAVNDGGAIGIVSAAGYDASRDLLETGWDETDWKQVYQNAYAAYSLSELKLLHFPDGWPARSTVTAIRLEGMGMVIYGTQRDVVTLRNGQFYYLSCDLLKPTEAEARQGWPAVAADAEAIVQSFRVEGR